MYMYQYPKMNVIIMYHKHILRKGLGIVCEAPATLGERKLAASCPLPGSAPEWGWEARREASVGREAQCSHPGLSLHPYLLGELGPMASLLSV